MLKAKSLLATAAVVLLSLAPQKSAYSMINSSGTGMYCTQWQTWAGGVETGSGWDCWYDDYSDGGGGGGGGGGEPPPPSGGGGGGNGIWITVADTEINVLKRQVRAKTVACFEGSPEDITFTALKISIADRYLIENPGLSASETVTVFFTDGMKQTYRRAGTLGSEMQMIPTSGCTASN